MPRPQPEQRPAVYGHRGGDGGPENSLEAIRAAAANGADGVEIDLQAGPGGQVVAGHDPIDWTTHNLKDSVTFGELLSTIDEVGIKLLIDFKSVGSPSEEAKHVAAALASASHLETITVSSFSVPFLQALRPLVPHLALIPIVSLRQNFPRPVDADAWPGYSVLAAALVNPYFLTQGRRNSKTLTVWFAATEWSWLIRLIARLGINAIIVTKLEKTRKMFSAY